MQYLVNSLIYGSLIMLVGLGFHFIYRTSGYLNFAHGLALPLASYPTFLFSRTLGLPLVLAAFLAILVALTCVISTEIMCYRPLRSRGASPLVLLLASLGIYVLGQNLLSLIWGDDTLSFRAWTVQEGLPLGSARITPVQLMIVSIGLVTPVACWFLFRQTSMGREMAAVGNDPQLARTCGVRVDLLHLGAIALGAILGSLAGVLMACDTDMTPQMGLPPLMLGIVAVVVGRNTFWGVVLAALLVAGLRNVSVIWIDSRWQDAITFIMLILFLVLPPKRILFQRVSRVTV